MKHYVSWFETEDGMAHNVSKLLLSSCDRFSASLPTETQHIGLNLMHPL